MAHRATPGSQAYRAVVRHRQRLAQHQQLSAGQCITAAPVNPYSESHASTIEARPIYDVQEGDEMADHGALDEYSRQVCQDRQRGWRTAMALADHYGITDLDLEPLRSGSADEVIATTALLVRRMAAAAGVRVRSHLPRVDPSTQTGPLAEIARGLPPGAGLTEVMAALREHPETRDWFTPGGHLRQALRAIDAQQSEYMRRLVEGMEENSDDA